MESSTSNMATFVANNPVAWFLRTYRSVRKEDIHFALIDIDEIFYYRYAKDGKIVRLYCESGKPDEIFEDQCEIKNANDLKEDAVQSILGFSRRGYFSLHMHSMKWKPASEERINELINSEGPLILRVSRYGFEEAYDQVGEYYARINQ